MGLAIVVVKYDHEVILQKKRDRLTKILRTGSHFTDDDSYIERKNCRSVSIQQTAGNWQNCILLFSLGVLELAERKVMSI